MDSLESRVLVKSKISYVWVFFFPGSVDSLRFLFLALVEKEVWVVLLGICGFVGISRSRKIENFICMGLFFPGSVDSLKLLFLALVEKIVWVVLLGICGFVGISRSRKNRKFHMYGSFFPGICGFVEIIVSRSRRKNSIGRFAWDLWIRWNLSFS